MDHLLFKLERVVPLLPAKRIRLQFVTLGLGPVTNSEPLVRFLLRPMSSDFKMRKL